MVTMKDEFQAFMMAEFKKYGEATGQWRPSLIGWAKLLGVGDASLDHWIAGRRIPDYSSAIILARSLGPKVYEILHYDQYAALDDPQLRMIAENWELLDDETKHQILTIAQTRGNTE